MQENNIFLISSSRYNNGDYFAHCAESLKTFLGPMDKDDVIAFVPYALEDCRAYHAKVKPVFAAMGYNLESVDDYSSVKYLFNSDKIKAVFVGGGNTFLLRQKMEYFTILNIIRDLVKNGRLKYIGSSAGTVMACPTIQTTNDMPIVEVSNFKALGLIDFQINPHFIPGSLMPGHMGETREKRIEEYHEHNNLPVIGLTEANWLIGNEKSITLHGEKDAFVFIKNQGVITWQTYTTLALPEK